MSENPVWRANKGNKFEVVFKSVEMVQLLVVGNKSEPVLGPGTGINELHFVNKVLFVEVRLGLLSPCNGRVE